MYDLEVSLNSVKYEIHSQLELSEYQGAKSFLVELNPGAYEIKITQKVAGTDQWDSVDRQMPKFVKF